jgi:hypothetical protein
VNHDQGRSVTTAFENNVGSVFGAYRFEERHGARAKVLAVYAT